MIVLFLRDYSDLGFEPGSDYVAYGLVGRPDGRYVIVTGDQSFGWPLVSPARLQSLYSRPS